jgi:isoquinoline 1-oxidoreductase alpha subunit
MTTSLHVNGQRVAVEAPGDKPLLWVLREDLGLTGTKFGCGVGVCRACTVLVDGQAMLACVAPLSAVAGAAVTTIEGLGADGVPDPVQQAWIDVDVPQCGYCQPGMILAAKALLARDPAPTAAALAEGLANICRCGTYDRIRTALRRLMAKGARS